jgi:phosphatidate cytidylyltransferase
MKTRVLTSIAIIAVVFFPLALGGIWLEALAVFIVCSGMWEWLRLLPGFDKWGIWGTVLASAAVLAGRWIFHWNYAYLAGIIGLIWSLPVFVPDFDAKDSLGMIAAVVVFSLLYVSIGWLVPQNKYLWTICFATYFSDTGAYLTGRKFGKHRMNPRVSPKKSWEGFAGGILLGAIASLLLSQLYVSDLNPALNLALCLLCPLFAEVGDLTFSAMKRSFGVKDFSDLLPGHGGVLDRVDSLLYNILLFGILFVLIP